MNRYIISLLLLIFFIQCSQAQGQIDDGDVFLSQGEVIRALETYQQLDSADPQVKGRIGLILSLDTITMITGMRMMYESLLEQPDFRLRRHLFLIYLQVGLNERARAILDAESISLDRYFSPEISVLRKGYACYIEPDKQNLAEITEARSAEAPWFTMLCLLKQAYTKYAKSKKEQAVPFDTDFSSALNNASTLFNKENLELFTLLQRTLDEKQLCELQIFYAVDSLVHSMTIQQCQNKYPDSLLLQRGRVPNLSNVDFFREQEKLFNDSYYFPDHQPVDRPEYDPDYVPPWEEEADVEEENYENYQRRRQLEEPDTNP